MVLKYNRVLFRTYVIKIGEEEHTITKEMVKEVKRYEKEVHGRNFLLLSHNNGT